MSGMRYIWVRGKRPRMHIMRFSALGEYTMQALCSSRLPFDASINAPFGLGRPVCKHCQRVAARLHRIGA